jgi:hypothetical protein
VGLSVKQITIFCRSFLYVGGLVLQYPIGWAVRPDRPAQADPVACRLLRRWSLTVAAAFALPLPFAVLVGSAVVLGGVINPLYSLLIAYTNDFLTKEQMAAASQPG